MMTLRVDGKELALDASQWSAHQASRRSAPFRSAGSLLVVTTDLRMVFGEVSYRMK
jgi:hypothetical protein